MRFKLKFFSRDKKCFKVIKNEFRNATIDNVVPIFFFFLLFFFKHKARNALDVPVLVQITALVLLGWAVV